MKNRIFLNKNTLITWILFHAVIAVCFLLFGNLSINTSLYSILPDTNPVQQLSDVEKVLTEQLNSNLTVLIGHEDFEVAKSAAEKFTEMTGREPGIGDLQLQIDSSAMSGIQQYLHDYRYHFLTPGVKELLEDDNVQALGERAFFTLSSPVSMGSLDYLDEDPFLLANETFQYFLNSGVMGNMAVGVRDSVLSRDYSGKSWILISLKTTASGTDVDIEQNPVQSLFNIAEILENETSGVEVLFSGVPVHSYDSARRSQNEISLLSTISSIFIIFLILFVFRSIKPLTATLIAIGAGILTGLATTLVVFQDMHIFTLVFGTSLIGISVDYSFHYFTEWSEQLDNRTIIKKIRSGISIGLVTTMLSYAAFTLSSFPLLQQMALFSIAGLVSTYISVLFLYPILKTAGNRTKISSEKSIVIVRRFFHLPSFFPRWLSYCIIALILVSSIWGLANFRLSNNIRDLYKMSDQLFEWEKKSSEILDHGSSGIYFLIEGLDIEDNLRKEEALIKKLKMAVKDETIESFLSLSTFLPSQKMQRENLQQISDKLFPAMTEQLSFLGYDSSVYEENKNRFNEIKKRNMTLEDLNNLPLNSLSDALHVGPVGDKYYTSVLLFGIRDLDRMQVLSENNPGIYLVNKTDDTNKVLQELSIIALIIIGVSYIVIFLGLIFRYRIGGAFRIVSIPIAASILTLSMITFAGLPVNLFVVVGMILIPGMGTDYIILLSESDKKDYTVLLSITLSMLTSVMSFGLLGFTSIAGGFGLTVSFGVFVSYLLTLFFNSANLGIVRKK